jgi:hypothetical protein
MQRKMRKDPSKKKQPLQVDPITGEYFVIIPDYIINDLGWYEDQELNIDCDGTEIIISELTD